MTSKPRLEHNSARPVSPVQDRTSALKIVPMTMNKKRLLTALQESEERENALKDRIVELQASNILNEAFCSRISRQLAHQEKKKEKGKTGGKLMGSGLPCLLSDDGFFGKVVDQEETQSREVQEKATRQEMRGARAEALLQWKEQQNQRQNLIKARRLAWEEEKRVWEVEKAAAKKAKVRFSRKKPTLGKLPEAPPPPRPRVIQIDAEGSENA